jgi:hypothetical protein
MSAGNGAEKTHTPAPTAVFQAWKWMKRAVSSAMRPNDGRCWNAPQADLEARQSAAFSTIPGCGYTLGLGKITSEGAVDPRNMQGNIGTTGALALYSNHAQLGASPLLIRG